jgi:SNF2 family DNA or RNA helicase
MSNYQYFKLGHCGIFTSDKYEYDISRNLWAFVENNKEYTLNIPENKLGGFSIDIIKYLHESGIKNIATINLNGQTWGLHINLDTIDEIYSGKLPDAWKKILHVKIIQNLVFKYSEFLINNGAVCDLLLRSSEDEELIDENIITKNIYKILSSHQKHEIGWMHSWEKTRALVLEVSTNYIPLFDTGYYYCHTNPDKLYKKTDLTNSQIELNGGILASEIGSGKTLSSLSLVKIDTMLDKKSEPTLIIVTKNILWQWFSEIKKFFGTTLNVCVLENESDLIKNLASMSDSNIVLIHRKILYSHSVKIVLGLINWKRIILDEIHEIINGLDKYDRSLTTSDVILFQNALKQMKTKMIWGLTGTISDLYDAQLKTIFDIIGFSYNKYIASDKAWTNIKTEFVRNAIRRNPKPKLPKLIINQKYVKFTRLQWLLYKNAQMVGNHLSVNELCSHTSNTWKIIDEESTTEMVINYLLKKRQLKIDQLEIDKKKYSLLPNEYKTLEQRIKTYKEANDLFQDVIEKLESDDNECPICLGEFDNEKLTINECLHTFCSDCFDMFVKNQANSLCPSCKQPLNDNTVIIHPKYNTTDASENKLMRIIKAIKEVPSDEKIIIFTQFNNLVEHLCTMFDDIKIKYKVLKGEPSEINISLMQFRKDKTVKILLMSIEQSVSGINVIEANHIFFVHPIFANLDKKMGLTIESVIQQYKQCIGRSYRYGQTKPVNVSYFITNDSIETKLVDSFLIEKIKKY